MVRIALERVRGYLVSGVLHCLLLAFLLLPWYGWFGGGKSSNQTTAQSHYAPIRILADRPSTGRSTCLEGPCIGEGPKSSSVPEPTTPQGEELEFLDDTGHALMAALRRANGWVAIVSRSDRWHALAFYRAVDGVNVGSGVEIARFPLRVVVHDPESYQEIKAWLITLDLALGSFRTLAVFPPQTQRSLHEAIEAEAQRIGLAGGPRRAVVSVSSADVIGIAVRSVALRSDVQPRPFP